MNLQTKDGRIPYDNYVVKIPVRGRNGKLEYEIGFIPAYHDVSIGYLDYTRENILHLAFASEGERYGWGGMFDARDCSQFIMEIYRCFGILLARNTGGQMAILADTLRISDLQDAEKEDLLDLVPLGSALYFQEHAMIYLGEAN